MKPHRRIKDKERQRGIALLIFFLIAGVVGIALFVSQLNSARIRLEREKITVDALKQAKEALIGDAISQTNVVLAGDLRLPDLGFGVGGTLKEGYSAPNFAGNDKNISVIGKLPWKTLGIAPLRDDQGECLWYVVSGRFKNSPPRTTDTLNWDTLGQIDILDQSGNPIASNLAALIVAPGPPLDGQSRLLANAAYTECGGNYDARNYLDSFNAADAISGAFNYFNNFTGSTNHRLAPDTNNKSFVLVNSDHFNDRFMFVTADDIFGLLIKRSDFAKQINDMLDDPTFQSHLKVIAISSVPGNKGTDNVDCDNAPNKGFCTNWKEMLFLTELIPPSPITIDSSLTGNCQRVLIFAGQKISPGQARSPAAEKLVKANYLEGTNLTAFNVPTTSSTNFNGSSAFSASNPGADIVKCLP